MLENLQRKAPEAPVEKLRSLLSFGLAVHSADADLNLPDFPIDNLHLAAKMLNVNPEESVHEIIMRLYPYQTNFKKEQLESIKTLLKSLKISNESTQSVEEIKTNVIEKNGSEARKVQFQIDSLQIYVPTAEHVMEGSSKKQQFVNLQNQRNLLAKLIQSYSVGDVCLIGNKGVGKNTLIQQLVDSLDQTVEPMMLYEDMTSRDLIQQRITTDTGDTVWRDSPLIRAARNGSVALLSGIHNLHKSTVTVLQRLIDDREVQLCDGSTLLRHDRYDALLSGCSKLELAEKGIFRIHEGFRIIALAEPPALSGANKNWLTPEVLSLFLFLDVRPLQKTEEYQIIQHLYGNEVLEQMKPVVELAHQLRYHDASLSNLGSYLSTRQLLKLAHHMHKYADTNVYDMLQNIFLAKFMPALTRATLEDALHNAGIEPQSTRNDFAARKQITIDNNVLKIGNTCLNLTKANDETKVPSTLFYDMPQHIALLERLLQDFLMGEHLLMVGNQGVGKNKLVDKLLNLMHKSREYLQLHRDTTVHSLTVQSTLRDGQVVYEDSSLVKAVKNGHVLVIDEADKAPVNVTLILRTLVERGEMMLSDGRKIVPSGTKVNNATHLIVTHPDFRVIVLANRPGFPFLGNDFFAALGDVFTCHAIDNPSPESEIFLLQQYAPTLPKQTLSTLVNAFGELRNLADEGLLNYPYSTREVVNIVKHLAHFPQDDIVETVGNVLDFDRYQPEVLDQVLQVLAKHGLAIQNFAQEELQALRLKKELQLTVERKSGLDVSSPKYGKVDPKNEPHVGGNTWAGGTGGRDTAGLGGKGGPFRLDAGHTVHQLSDEEKNAIPEEVKKAAREMNRKAYEEKLKEIKMSEYDHRLYLQFSAPIAKQVQQLKAILDVLQTRTKERQWQKYQTHGELDDTRLIEGVTGERNIYRRRAEASPWADNLQEKPHRLKLVVDVSGSMYRFNGYDGRLDRELEATLMVMEAFEGYEKKIVYDIVGHSGEGWALPFVTTRNPPKTDKERFETLKMMHAHSQFCWSGDSTVKAIREAVKELSDGSKEDYDENIVVVLSDANLARYGINPKDIAKALMQGDQKVKAYIIFIGSLAEEANIINTQMPAGHSFVCMDVSKLPQILKQIFTSTLL